MEEGKDCVLALFGCFNPPTSAHVHLFGMAHNRMSDEGFSVQKAYFVPTNGGYNKPGLAESSDRVRMCELAAHGIEWMDTEPFETQRPEWTKAVVTLQYLQSKHPDCRIIFVCGDDLVLRWNDDVWPDEEVIKILTDYGVCMASRSISIHNIVKEVPILNNRLKNVYLMQENPMGDISSSYVRDLLRNGKQIVGLVPPLVEKYIRENKFYTK